MKTFGYSEEIKLKSKTDISLLFEKGKWKTCGNLRMISMKNEKGAKIGVSVSKRNFKKAVDRNRIKRLLREAYRLNKEEFHNAFGENISAMLFWISKHLPQDYHAVKEDFTAMCHAKKKV